jgi:hypothetical protein
MARAQGRLEFFGPQLARFRRHLADSLREILKRATIGRIWIFPGQTWPEPCLIPQEPIGRRALTAAPTDLSVGKLPLREANHSTILAHFNREK